MLPTTATKRSIRPSPDSQRDSPGCEDSPRASSRTAASLSASGGSVVPGAPCGSLPPGVGTGSGLAGATGAPGTCAGGTASCAGEVGGGCRPRKDRKSTRLNSSHLVISYASFRLKKKKKN